jgi:hypothetical protein
VPKNHPISVANKYITLTLNGSTDIECGEKVTFGSYAATTYEDTSENHKYGTMWAFLDTTKHQTSGVRGNVKISLNNNELPYFEFDMKGLYLAPVDESAGSYDYSAWRMPYVVSKDNTEVTVAGKKLNCSRLEIDLGNQVEHRGYTETEDVLIVGRKTTASISWECDTIDAKDWFTFVREAQKSDLSVTHGVEGTDMVAITVPSCVMNNLDYSEENGVYFFSATLTATYKDDAKFVIGIDV